MNTSLRFSAIYNIKVRDKDAKPLFKLLQKQGKATGVPFHIRKPYRFLREMCFPLPQSSSDVTYIRVSTGKRDRFFGLISDMEMTLSKCFANLMIKPWAEPLMRSKLPYHSKLGLYTVASTVLYAGMFIATLPFQAIILAVKIPIWIITMPSILHDLSHKKLKGEDILKAFEPGSAIQFDFNTGKLKSGEKPAGTS